MFQILQRLLQYAFNLLIVLAILWGINHRNDNLITAESGLGYAFGIIGGVLMILLLIYPLRKRIRLVSRFGSIKFWFRTHMFFGVVGPVLVMFHSNFHIGSLNSTIAMVCMLTVAGSGLLGRFLYAKIHHGLYGSQIEMKELQEEAGRFERGLQDTLDDAAVSQRLHTYSEGVFENSRSVLASIWLFLKSQLLLGRARRKELATIDKKMKERVAAGAWSQGEYKAHKTITTKLLKNYFKSIQRTINYRVSERLFSLWHMLHLPIFFMMLLSAIVHIVMVHMY